MEEREKGGEGGREGRKGGGGKEAERLVWFLV